LLATENCLEQNGRLADTIFSNKYLEKELANDQSRTVFPQLGALNSKVTIETNLTHALFIP